MAAGNPMRLSHTLVVLAATLGCALGGPMARADIYKWVNEEGAVTFGNVPPKDRSRIVEVFPSSEWPQPNPPAAPPAGRQTEDLQILADRVDRLARTLEDERRFSEAQPVAYPQYAAAPPMWDDGGWGYGGWGYDGWWNGGWGYGGWYGPTFFAPSPVLVVGTSHRFRHSGKFHHVPKSAHFGHGSFRSHSGATFRTGGGPRFQSGGGPRFQSGSGPRFQGARGGGRMR